MRLSSSISRRAGPSSSSSSWSLSSLEEETTSLRLCLLSHHHHHHHHHTERQRRRPNVSSYMMMKSTMMMMMMMMTWWMMMMMKKKSGPEGVVQAWTTNPARMGRSHPIGARWTTTLHSASFPKSPPAASSSKTMMMTTTTTTTTRLHLTPTPPDHRDDDDDQVDPDPTAMTPAEFTDRTNPAPKRFWEQPFKQHGPAWLRPFQFTHNNNNNNNSANATTTTTTTTTSTTSSSSSSSSSSPVLVPRHWVTAWIQLQEWLHQQWHKGRWILVSFVAGMTLTGTALLLPLYWPDTISSPQQQQQQASYQQTILRPTILMETILQDLAQQYVDPIDATQLFETAMAAMLQSLDPYTEFEPAAQAAALEESIQGTYGGVGLVIAGTAPSKSSNNNNNNNNNNNVRLSQSSSSTTTPPGTTAPTTTTTSPSDTQKLPDATDNDDNDHDDNMSSSTGGGGAGSPTTTPTPPLGWFSPPLPGRMRLPEETTTPSSLLPARPATPVPSIRVVMAMEGYAFDYGLRVGDQLLAVDDQLITPETSVEQVRQALRGEPGTMVTITFSRDGLPDTQSVTMPRALVQLRDVKCVTLLGNPADGIGYIQLSGFAANAGREVRNAIQYLERAAEHAAAPPTVAWPDPATAPSSTVALKGLILDLRGNPGGLLTSAVDVASLLVPKGSDIVSAQGRGFPGVLYRSRVDPLVDTRHTKLAVLVNGQTASAAEIVSGAIQDLDVGLIVGADRTFGKGLVQNVQELPYDTALKFTIAKYYTPSGRCIQGMNYKEGSLQYSSSSSSNSPDRDDDDNDDENDGGIKGRYIASKVEEKDRSIFYTKRGRVVRDGGGIEADYKIPSQKASALEVTLLRSNVFSEFASEWSKKHELTNNFAVDEDTYRDFQAFVHQKQRNGDLQLEILYSKPLGDLKKALQQSGYKGAEKSVEQLQARILREIENDFDKYRSDIKEDISQSILARYLPESMLIERGVKTDKQVQETVKLLTSTGPTFDKLLSRSPPSGDSSGRDSSSLNTAQAPARLFPGFRTTIQW